MGRQQLTLLLIATSALAMLVASLFVLPWFIASVSGGTLEIDLRSVSLCTDSAAAACAPVDPSQFTGPYPLVGEIAFWCGLVVVIGIVIQCASRLVTATASIWLSRVGYVVACASVVAGFAAAFVVAPDAGAHGPSLELERTWAPVAFVIGNMVALLAFYQATAPWSASEAEYKPIKLEKGRLPVTPLSFHRVPVSATGTSADASRTRTLSSSPPPVTEGRTTRAPTSPPVGDARSKTPSSSPPSSSSSSSSSSSDLAGTARGDSRSRTPSGQLPRASSPSSDLAGTPRIESRSRTPSVQIPRASSPSFDGAGTTRGDARSRTPSGQLPRASVPAAELDARQKPPSQPPFAANAAAGSAFVARTPSPSHGVPLVARTASPGMADARAKSGSQPPLDARAKSGSQPPLVARTASSAVDPVERSRTSSSGPIDLSARLSAAAPGPIGIAMRPPLPTPEPIPPDQIPVDPAAGLTIRKRTPSAAPLPDSAFAPPSAIAIAPESGLVIRAKSPTAAPPPSRVNTPAMPAIALDGIADLAELKKELSAPVVVPVVAPVVTPVAATVSVPAALQRKLKFAVVSVELASSGVRARREDGTELVVEWDKIVGVVARRLPSEAPYDSTTMVDVVSTAGSTLRVLPWTRITGGLPLSDAPVERARELVNVVAAQALGARLDAATKKFAEGTGQAAQIPTLATLATHDSKV